MAVLSATNANNLLDGVVSALLRARGTLASNMGLGTASGGFGAYDELDDARVALGVVADPDPIEDIGPGLRTFRDSLLEAAVVRGGARALLAGLNAHARRFGGANYSTLDGWLVYLNTALSPKWQALQHWELRTLILAAQPGATPSRACFYYEVLQGSEFANGLRSENFATTTETAGASIGANFAGGFPQIRVSSLTGSGIVTVTGTAFNPATRATVANATWTANVTANGVTALAPGGGSPAPADSLILDCSAIAKPVGITAGTAFIEAARPSGRPLLPN